MLVANYGCRFALPLPTMNVKNNEEEPFKFCEIRLI